MSTNSKRSIREKLTTIIMLTSTTAVLLACLGFVISDMVSLRRGLAGDLATLAQVVGSNSIVALTFGDQQGAQEVLNSLHAKPSIVAACIYTERGDPFVRYEPNEATVIPRLAPIDGVHDSGEHLGVASGIQFGRRRIGTIYIISDSRDRNTRLTHDVEIAGLIVLVALLFAFFLSSRLQRTISAPIVELARVANLVSLHKNYSVRANLGCSTDGDEIEHLMAGFNSMLVEIEQRDDQLLVAKNAAEEAAEINAKLARESALILNSATDGIMGIGLDGRTTFINPAGARILGVTPGNLIGKSIHESIHHSYPDGTPWPEVDCENTAAVRRGEAISIVNDTFWRPDGTSFPVEYSSTSIFDEDGTQRGAVVVFRDVTERREIERLKSEFVSTVSHELRTPLTSIRSALGLLGSGLLGPMAEKGQRMLEIAVVNADRLVRLINDILDLERIGSGKVELERGPLDAHALMVQASESLQSIADQAKVRLVVVPGTATICGDNDRIMQTLTNLLGNAIKFSPPDTTVTLSGAAGATEFAFCIADQGRGVPQEKLEMIFERFSQVDASDSRDKGGSGLGLAICQSIVNAHGGRIWTETNHPAGTRFLFTIPLTVPSASSSAATETATETSAETRARVVAGEVGIHVASGLSLPWSTEPAVTSSNGA